MTSRLGTAIRTMFGHPHATPGPDSDPIYGAALSISTRQRAIRRTLAEVRDGRTVEECRRDAAAHTARPAL